MGFLDDSFRIETTILHNSCLGGLKAEYFHIVEFD